MPFESRDFKEILAELQDKSQLLLSKIEGSFECDIFESNSIEFAKIEIELAEAYRNSFAHTSSAEYLDLHAQQHGIFRKQAVKAIGELEVIGNGTIHEGALFQTESGTKFIAVSETKVVGSAVIAIVAADSGASGNVAANTITKIPMSIPGIRSCTNPEKTHDGYDEEDDETLRERLLTAVRYPAASGSPLQYISWSLETPGVGAARCIRCFKGRGTVQVVIVDANFQEASSVLLQEVYNKIYDEMPADVAELSVVSAKSLPINISARIRGNVNTDNFIKAVQNYFTSLVKLTVENSIIDGTESAGYVSVAKIGQLIITAGSADDYFHETLKLNGQNENINLRVDEIPVIGELNFYA